MLLATTDCLDTRAPTAPTGLSVVSAARDSLTVGWQSSTDDRAVSGYEVSVDGTVAGRTSATSYRAASLACGRTYSVSVKAYDAAGNLSGAAALQAATSQCATAPSDTSAPTAARRPAAMTDIKQTAMTMPAWSASTDNVGVAGYRVYLDGVRVGTTTALSYTYTGLTCGTTYDVALTAYDAAGNETDPKFARGPETTAACTPTSDTQAPTMPSGFAMVNATGTAINVKWNASTDNVAVMGYGLYRNGSAAGGSTGLTGSVTGLTCGTTYTLALDAYDGAGNRSARTSMSAATAACQPAGDTTPPTVPSGVGTSAATATSVTLSWSPSTDNVAVTGYGVYVGSTRSARRSRRPTSRPASPAERRTRSVSTRPTRP